MFLRTIKGKKISKLDQEKKALRDENEKLKLQNYHSKILAEDTLELLNLLQDIDRKGNSEESKIEDRNVIINNLRQRNINIIKELDVGKTF